MSALTGLNEYRIFVESVAKHLEADILQQAKDVEYGQWELPFEAVLLELMKCSKHNICFDNDLVNRLAIEADIIECGVLDMDTWQKFCSWAKF